MLSKKMYAVLSCFPRSFAKSIRYEELLAICKLSENELNECLVETTQHEPYYIGFHGGFREGGTLSLTEIGLAAVEAYEDALRNQETVTTSLAVAKIAMWAAVASAVAAFVPLIVEVIEFIQKLIPAVQ